MAVLNVKKPQKATPSKTRSLRVFPGLLTMPLHGMNMIQNRTDEIRMNLFSADARARPTDLEPVDEYQ